LEKEIGKQQQDVLRRKVYVKGLPVSCDQAKLIEAFSTIGLVDKAFILYNHKNGASRGFGFVEFAEESSVTLAMKNPVRVCGKEILISLAVERHKGVVFFNLEKESCWNLSWEWKKESVKETKNQGRNAAG
jgi:RNA recognition motif-containing protein